MLSIFCLCSYNKLKENFLLVSFLEDCSQNLFLFRSCNRTQFYELGLQYVLYKAHADLVEWSSAVDLVN